ncbi:uncharacterized protein LOC135144566 [Zophobas morio]|uniref:uncharacterized protein LOC135144566 n=1 Tax=Zophobas morio TaxID=2755281 RepID=UPI0030834332
MYSRTKSTFYADVTKKLCSDIKSMIKIDYAKYITEIEQELRNNRCKLWSYIDVKKKTSRIPGKMSFNSQEYLRPTDIVNAFAKYFNEVYVSNGNSKVYETSEKICDTYSDIASDTKNNSVFDSTKSDCDFAHVLHMFKVLPSDVVKVVKRVKPNFTARPDYIPAFFVKDTISCLCEPLCYLYNLVINNYTYPNCWKLAKVTPLFKSGSKQEITNYRPVAIVNNFAKIFDYILSDILYSHTESLIVSKQHGFMKHRSTSTNLCEFIQYVSNALNSGYQVDVIFTDLSKAFDVVDHHLLINKLSHYGLCNGLVSLEYKNCKSNEFLTSSGVLQGSNLGPTLFNLFINDVVQRIDGKVFMYADDIKIARIIREIKDCDKMQEYVNKFTVYTDDNKLKINILKCYCMTFSRKDNIIVYDYTVKGIQLKRCKEIRDFGVILDSSLSFVPHVNSVCSSALKSLDFIKRNTYSFQNLECLMTLHNAFSNAARLPSPMSQPSSSYIPEGSRGIHRRGAGAAYTICIYVDWAPTWEKKKELDLLIPVATVVKVPSGANLNIDGQGQLHYVA